MLVFKQGYYIRISANSKYSINISNFILSLFPYHITSLIKSINYLFPLPISLKLYTHKRCSTNIFLINIYVVNSVSFSNYWILLVSQIKKEIVNKLLKLKFICHIKIPFGTHFILVHKKQGCSKGNQVVCNS